MERWGFLFSVMSSPIVYFLTILLAVCPNINPTILCAHVCDVNYAACYCYKLLRRLGAYLSNQNNLFTSKISKVVIEAGLFSF